MKVATTWTWIGVVLCVFAVGRSAVAEDAFYIVPLQKLTLTDGKLPPNVPSIGAWQTAVFAPRAIVEGGEAYFGDASPGNAVPGSGPANALAIRLPRGQEVKGQLFLARTKAEPGAIVSFKLPADVKEAKRDEFLRVKKRHYERLQSVNAPGAAWFRHQARVIGKQLGEASPSGRAGASGVFPGDLIDTYSLFSGGRALSENLQLDRLLPAITVPATGMVDVNSVEGITVEEFDWKEKTQGLQPQLDPLTAAIPFDQHALKPYVKITPSRQARGENQQLEKVGLYYVATGKQFLLTLNEDLLKRAIDRELARGAATQPASAPSTREAAASQPAQPWIGDNVAAHVEPKAFEALPYLFPSETVGGMPLQAWRNIPILNEWKRLFPEQDPVQAHERYWGTALRDPAGGRYVWNEKWQTVESTQYGHPGEPKEGPAMPPTFNQVHSADFGLTFEDKGLRARVQLHRETPAATTRQAGE